MFLHITKVSKDPSLIVPLILYGHVLHYCDNSVQCPTWQNKMKYGYGAVESEDWDVPASGQ
jgi:hypothetical protein